MAIEVISAAVALLLLAGLWRGSLREVRSDEAHWGRRWGLVFGVWMLLLATSIAARPLPPGLLVALLMFLVFATAGIVAAAFIGRRGRRLVLAVLAAVGVRKLYRALFPKPSLPARVPVAPSSLPEPSLPAVARPVLQREAFRPEPARTEPEPPKRYACRHCGKDDFSSKGERDSHQNWAGWTESDTKGCPATRWGWR